MTDLSLNPLLRPSSLSYGAPAFDQIKTEHYIPALTAALDDARADIAAMKANAAAPDFSNTIEALEEAGQRMGLIHLMYQNQLSACNNDDLQALSDQIGPMMAAFSSDISMDPGLFARVRAVYESRTDLTLTKEQETLLTETYKGFVRNGALLNEADKEALRAIDERLSVLAPAFQNNVTKATEDFTLYLTDPAEIEGLPDNARASAQEEARAAGHKDGYLFTLHAPSLVPFLTFVKNRILREKMWRASGMRAGPETPYNNEPFIREIVTLKARRASLLGYKNHADFVLAERMAGSPARVLDFIQDLLKVYKPAADRDLADLRAYGAAHEGLTDVQPWDLAYLREKLQQARYHFESESLRPYFPLDRVLKGTFAHFERLFGVRFTPAPHYPVWHKDVTVYEVHDAANNAFMGLLYADFYPRTGKRPGAWMTDYRPQGRLQGKMERPHIAIVCNFIKPAGGKPSLLTHEEVLTLFHEMGHAMHGMLSNCLYTSLSGTNVKWDFVELPSQIQENWTYEPETLALIAGHHETGAPIPVELVQKLRATQTYMAGINGLRQMAFSWLDMMWYTADPTQVTDVGTFEDRALEGKTLFPRLAGPSSNSFGHIFGGGYAAGYYSYKWAEVLDADAFEAFKEKGLYDPETAARYRDEILSRGGSEDPNVLYVRFRGRAPDPASVLRREGLSA